ncbi:MAG TPA: SDR family oxidoreductase [Chloroflexota bacterium]|nr:SDR family oxidoreductase [Chloroflexota bacterium]
MGTLSGQTAIVAGASSGMGRATALTLAKAGCRVFAAARKEESLKELAAEAAAAGCELRFRKADASKRAEVDALIQEAVDCFGKIDVLVNSVGTNTPDRKLSVLSDENWHHLVDTNLNGAYYLTQAILPQFRKQGGGLLIHITSVSGRFTDYSGAAYQAAKAGVNALAHATMLEERANGVRVSIIMPGLCDTPIMLKRAVQPSRETLDKALTPQDIADACLFLSSLPARTYVPEMIVMPNGLQCLGQTHA